MIAAPNLSPASGPQHAPHAHRILLVEDNRSDAMLINYMLRSTLREPFEFQHVPRVFEALELMHSQQFDMAILDLGLPDMTGPSAVAAIHTQAPEMPILVHTSQRDPILRNEVMMCGAQYYWVKGQESSIFFKHLVMQALNDSGV